MELGLRGRTAIVTGGSRGIGRAIVQVLAEEGVDVFTCARNADVLQALQEELSALPGSVHGSVVDVADADAVREWVRSVGERSGAIDIVVSNVSGLSGAGVEAWRRNFELDLLGYVQLVESAQPYLEQSGRGAIVAIGTTAAIETFGSNPSGPYGAIKAATIHHSSGLAQRLASKGIRSNVVSPGPVYFEGGAWADVERDNPEFFERIVSSIPRGRMGDPREIAQTVAFLASDAASNITGINLVSDGGMTQKIKY